MGIFGCCGLGRKGGDMEGGLCSRRGDVYDFFDQSNVGVWEKKSSGRIMEVLTHSSSSDEMCVLFLGNISDLFEVLL
jgi:hypothetical protein